jgi:hypothetical protein
MSAHASGKMPEAPDGDENRVPDDCFRDESGVPESLSWTVHLAQHQPGRVAATMLGISVTWWVALAAFHSPFMAIVSSLAILGAVAEALFPIHHRVTPQGVTTRCAWQWRTMPWEAVRGARMGRDGIHLSPLTSSSRRSHIRGVTLRFADGNDSAVTALVRRYLDEARRERTAHSAEAHSERTARAEPARRDA